MARRRQVSKRGRNVPKEERFGRTVPALQKRILSLEERYQPCPRCAGSRGLAILWSELRDVMTVRCRGCNALLWPSRQH